MKKTAILLLSALCALSLPAISQSRVNKAPTNNNSKDSSSDSKSSEEDGTAHFWEVKMDSGDFMTTLDKIVSISKSQYLLDGNLIVNEVTIDSGGRSLARFYHISTLADSLSDGKAAIASKVISKAQGALDDAADKAGTDVHNMVQKTYPATTHTGMVEYRVMNLTDLDAIYTSVQTAWQTGKPKKLTIAK